MDEIIEEVVVVEQGDMFLKFASEAEAKATLFKQASYPVTTYDEEGVATVTDTLAVDEEGNPVMVLKWDMVVDFVGVIYKPTGKMLTSEDGEYPEMAELPGFHVNTRGQKPDELQSFKVEPVTPSRVWA